jgi:hypothetical protein
MTEVIYLSEAFTLTIKRQAFELTLRLDACIYLDSFPSNARRPHKSPAHTVKDQSLATDFSIRPQDLSSRVSRPFYISLRFRQHPRRCVFAGEVAVREGAAAGWRILGSTCIFGKRFCEKIFRFALNDCSD